MNLYMQQTMVVRTENGDSEPGEIGRGVRQGWLLTPLLFSIYAEMMIAEAMEDVKEGVRVEWVAKGYEVFDEQGIVTKLETINNNETTNNNGRAEQDRKEVWHKKTSDESAEKGAIEN